MPDYRVLVTDITNFGDLRCVAGWDLDREKMIRPEPGPKQFWPSASVGPVGPFDLRAIVRFKGAKPVPRTDYPHLTEDRVVAGKVVAESNLAAADYIRTLRAVAFDSLDELFAGNLIIDGSKAYVRTGTKCRSLGGLEVAAKGATIEPYTNYGGKLRLRLRFRDQATYLAPNLTSSRAYKAHRQGRIDEINGQIAKASRLLLRIGLARGFPDLPDRCYLQVNGISIVEE